MNHTSLFPKCFQLSSIIVLLSIGSFPYFRLNIFKVVCCRFVVCGRGLDKEGFTALFPTISFVYNIGFTDKLRILEQAMYVCRALMLEQVKY